MDFPIRFEYDDQFLEIIEKINRELAKRNLVLEDDQQEHDGYNLYRLRELQS